jgi:hypothetical protein
VLHSAKARDIPVAIQIEDAWAQFEAQGGVCALSGVALQLSFKKRGEHTASLDRIDSGRGYERGNIQFVHKTVQLMKNYLNQEEFVSWCSSVACFSRKIAAA